MISKGLSTRLRQTAVLLVAFGGSWIAPSAHSAITDQLLDQVEVASANKVLRLNESPTEVLGLAAVRQTRFRTCQSSNINGLFCLDGQTVRFWSTVTEHPLTAASPPAEAGTALFSCLDTALGLDSNGCSAMTADVNGDIWIAGQKQGGTTSSLFRVTAKVSGACPAGNYFTDSSVAYCADEVRTGRVGGIRDLSPVDGELVTGTSPGQFPDKGVLAVENFSTVVFYPRDKNISPVEIGNWGGVQLTSASILQRRSSSDLNTILTYGLVTTTAGNVLSRKLPSGAPNLVTSVNGTLGPLARGGMCVAPSNNPNTFRIRGSETSGRIIATNRDYCRLLLWTPLYNDAEEIVGADFANYPYINLLTGTAGGTTYPPDNLSVSAGNSVNTADPTCTMQSGPGATGGCPLIGDGGDTNGYPAVRMYGVTVEGPATGLFVFKIDAIPDCRYPDIKALYASDPNHPCNKPGTVVTPSGLTNPKPQQQYLNVTPLLPPSVTDLFNDSGTKPLGLPPLYISPRYRAQKAEGYFFQAIFGVADPNIQFRKTFTVEFDIGDPNLAGASLGCGVQSTVGDPPLPSPKPFNQLDVVTMVSERFSSVGGPTGLVLDSGTAKAEHVDQLINKGCYNPTPSAGTRWSMYAYNLALAEDKPPTTTSGSFTYSPAIAYLSNLVLALHTQLGDAQKKLACTNVDAVGNDPFDPNAAPPLTQATCNTLNTQWASAQDKLKKCAAAAQNPKNSAPNQNCNAFVSQFNTYKAMVEALTPSGQDPANRVGELWSRTDVIKYMYSHFLKAAQIGATAANSTSTP